MQYPQELIDALTRYNFPCRILNAQELANSLVRIIPANEQPTLFDGGGILSYLFLRRAGYQADLKEIVNTQRTYPLGVPSCRLTSFPSRTPRILIDDILASGQTVSALLNQLKCPDLDLICLLASSNIPAGGSEYRKREGSTVPRVSVLYCAQLVNGVPNKGVANKKPAILSLRYLITKAVDNEDYNKTYLVKKFGGIATTQKIQEAIRQINREPIDLLRSDPTRFLERYL